MYYYVSTVPVHISRYTYSYRFHRFVSLPLACFVPVPRPLRSGDRVKKLLAIFCRALGWRGAGSRVIPRARRRVPVSHRHEMFTMSASRVAPAKVGLGRSVGGLGFRQAVAAVRLPVQPKKAPVAAMATTVVAGKPGQKAKTRKAAAKRFKVTASGKVSISRGISRSILERGRSRDWISSSSAAARARLRKGGWADGIDSWVLHRHPRIRRHLGIGFQGFSSFFRPSRGSGLLSLGRGRGRGSRSRIGPSRGEGWIAHVRRWSRGGALGPGLACVMMSRGTSHPPSLISL